MTLNAQAVFQKLCKAYGPPETWINNCFAVATCCVAKCGVPGDAVYGSYTGTVAEGSPFYNKRRIGFVRHGWVLLKDGRVLDPTRWVFEGTSPYIFVGENADYDEGANKLRDAIRRPAPEWDASEPQVYFDGSSGAWNFIEATLGLHNYLTTDEYRPGHVTRTQGAWLANLSPHTLGIHAEEIYRWLEKNRLGVFIPVDNLAMVKRNARQV